MPIAWEAIWTDVAAQLNSYRGAGLAELLTEDVIRFATIQQLASSGMRPSLMEAEWRRRGVPDAVDLVVLHTEPAAIEFKYPREPRETNAAWTQHLGEVLKDFYRLAHMPAEFTQRWCVQLLSSRMRRYLDGVTDRYGLRLGILAGSVTLLDPARIRSLPPTAQMGLGRWHSDLPEVRATCRAVYPIGDSLWLTVHAVQPVNMPG